MPGKPRKKKKKRKRKRNAGRRKFASSASCDAARALQSAHACRRSTAALAKGTIHPQGSAQAMLPETWPERSILNARPNRGAETSRFSTGVTRAAPVPVQRSTSRAGHSAGRMMPKPPECDSDEPPPAGTALAPPDGVTGWRPFGERDAPVYSARASCQAIVASAVTSALIQLRFSLLPLACGTAHGALAVANGQIKPVARMSDRPTLACLPETAR